MASAYGYWDSSSHQWRSWVRITLTEDGKDYGKFLVEAWLWAENGSSSFASNIKGWAGIWDKANDYRWSSSANVGNFSSHSWVSSESTPFKSQTWTVAKTHSSQKVYGYSYIKAESGIYEGRISDNSGSGYEAYVTLSAKTKYTVSYNANNGSGAPSSQTKWHGETLELSSTKPTRSHYTFMGWATSQANANSGTVKYAAGANYTADAAITLYAVWKADTYTVSYNANGGSGTTASQTKDYGDPVQLANCGFTRTNYVFRAWNKKADGSDTNRSPGWSYTGYTTTTFYAIWWAPNYITYNANGGSGAPAKQTKVHGTTVKISSTKPTRSGYDFLGWATTSTATSKNDDYDPGDNYSTDSDLTLYAVWRPSAPTLRVTGYYRSDDVAVADDEGNYVTAKGTWSMPQAINCTIRADVYLATDTSHSTSLGNNSAPFTSSTGDDYQITITIPDGNGGSYVNPDLQYDVVVTATNTSVSPNASTSSTVRLGTAYYPIDVLNHETINGVAKKGIAFGKAAETDFLADFAFPVTSSHGVANKNAFFKSKRTDTGNSINFGVGSGGVNRGIWDDTLSRWLFYTNASGNVYLNGTVASVADDGTMTLAKPLPASSGGTGSDSYGTTKTVNVTADADAVSVATSTYVSMASLTLEKGTWLVVYNARFEPNNTGQRYLFVHTSLTSNSAMTTAQRAGGINANAAQGSGRSTLLNASRILQVSSQATYHAVVWQNSGSTLAVNGFLRAFKLI